MCDIATGRLLGCKGVVGGIKAIYAVNDTAGTASKVLTTADVTISGTDLALITDISPAVTVFKISLPRNTGMYEETIESNIENGTVVFMQNVTIQMHKLGPKTSQLLQDMAHARSSYFVEDNNGNVHLVGYNEGAELTAGGKTTGTTKADMSGYTATITAESPRTSYHLPISTGGTNAPFDGLTTPANVVQSAVLINPTVAA